MSIPMAHPMPAPANCSTRFNKELKPHGTGPASSPASMRAFNRSSNVGSGDSNTTVSTTSVIAFEDGAGRSNDAGEFSSEEQSHELRNLHGVKESSDFNYSNWAFTDSLLSLDFESSSHSSAKNADFNDEREYACDVKRAPILTFTVNNDSDNDDADGDGNRNEALVDECEPVKPAPVTNGNKGLCYRCFKGSRFTEKEVCLVCSAKYCGNCVLDAMGSMPEGRKRLLNELEVRQIMKAERFCEVNQLPPEYICVNGRPLSFEELVTLQNCAAPPKKLKPGSYWYDKVSGLWGEEGQKPCRIISPHLNVGGPIKPDASNGNTQVYINGREITEVELRMLQLAGVQCAGNPHFWVNEDGSYQEEGQKNIRGNIWGKSGTKLVCALLSLPVPSKCLILCGERTSSPVSKRVPDYLEHGIVQKLLLVGYGGSGTSAIFKQVIFHLLVTSWEDYVGQMCERFEEESLWNMKKRQSDVLDSTVGHPNVMKLRDFLHRQATEAYQFHNSVFNLSNNKTIYSIGTRLKAFSDWLLRTMASGKLDAIFPATTREYAPLIEEMWSSAAIKATYKRRREIEMLPSVASYFLERVVEILRADYEPSDLDTLYAEGVTSSNGLACVEFSFPTSTPEETVDTIGLHDSFARYQLITAHARGIGENCKWLEMLEDVGMVVFSVALSDYDQFSAEGNGCITNKMLSSRKLFETIVTHPTFEKMDFLLILNKLDQFEEKIKQVPPTRCKWFADFHPVISRQCSGNNKNSINNNSSLAQLASHHIAVKLMQHLNMLEIVKWNQERLNFSLSDNSMYSTEDSSFSFNEC
ncbi:Extra-large guanine nucleotide-binding protein [Arachis hypogaea]|nr:Extra-large guanine nucleotide-binding protein [Arachis hypogaea]